MFVLTRWNGIRSLSTKVRTTDTALIRWEDLAKSAHLLLPVSDQ